jgi:hypothetical protein
MPDSKNGIKQIPVARELAPAGLRSSPKTIHRGESETSDFQDLRLLRSRAGASSLATDALSYFQRNAAMASTDSRISAGPL